jgi:DNA-directed RNA polymerase specialized sigma subunit
MRYLALSKLDLNTREIAFLVGVSQDAIRQTKCRLNKKLGARFDSEA